MPARLPLLLLLACIVVGFANLIPPLKPAFIVAVVTCAGLGLFFHSLKPAAAQAMVTRVCVAAVGMPLLAWALPSVWLLYFAMLVWIPLLAGRTGNVAPVYLYTLLLLPGLDTTAAIGSIKLFDIGVHDALGLGAATALLVSTGKGRTRPALDLPVAALILMFTFVFARGTSITNTVRVAIDMGLDYGLPYYIVSRGIRSIEEAQRTQLWLACGAITLASILTYEAWTAWPIYNELYNHYSLSTLLLVKLRGGILRAGGPFVEPTSAAMILGMCIFALWLSRDFFRSKWHHVLVMGASLVGLAAPQSRGAWIGLMLAIAAALFFRRRYFTLARWSAVLAAIGVLLYTLAQNSPTLAESIGLTGNSADTSEYRRDLLSRGMEEFWKKPLSGYSMPDLLIAMDDMKQGEGIVDFVNTYLWIMLVAGAFGVFLFAGTFIYFLVRLLPLRRPIPDFPQSITVATFAFGALIMPFEMLFFTSFGGRVAFFVFGLFGFTAALVTIRERERRKRRAVRSITVPAQGDGAELVLQT